MGIERHFLANCVKLTAVDLSPLTSTVRIGAYFLSGCSSLTEVDLSHSAKTTYVGDCNFLHNCTALKRIRLNGCSRAVEHVVRISKINSLVIGTKTKIKMFLSGKNYKLKDLLRNLRQGDK